MKNEFRIIKDYLLLLCLLAVSVIAGSQTIQHNFDWNTPYLQQGDADPIVSSLYFEGALYNDTMPGLPVWIHRTRALPAGYDLGVEIGNHAVVGCSGEEVLILEEMGFKNPEFSVAVTTETTMGEAFDLVHLMPVRKRDGVFEKLLNVELSFHYDYTPIPKSLSHRYYPASSVLSSGNWYRLCVDKEGIYQVGRQELQELGVPISQLDKSTIQIYGNGGGMLPESNDAFRYTDLQENAIWISGAATGAFSNDDFILFYGQSPNRWKYNPQSKIFEHEVHSYTTETCYFLTYGQQNGKRIATSEAPVQQATHVVNTFHDFAHYQRDAVNLLGSGKTWFGELFDITLSRVFNFSFPNLVQQPIQISVYAAARSSATSSFTMESFGKSHSFSIANVNVANATGVFARHAIGNLLVTPQGDNVDVKLTYNRSASGSRGWLNYITINAQRRLLKTDPQMFFRNPSTVGQGNIVRFELGGLAGNNQVWDVTDHLNVTKQQLSQSGATASFVTSGDQLREFVVFDDVKFPKPRLRGQVANQDLHGTEVHDLVIVVPDLFRQEADRLAEFRRQFDKLSVLLVSPQQIYNEFSSGVADIAAIRNFMKMFYDRALEPDEFPRYLLLFGNGTFDNRNMQGYGGNLIPTFQTVQSLSPASSYTSDDFFGLLDDNEGFDAQGAIDLGIGRLPVRTVDEARFVVDKILRYNQRIEGLEVGTDDPRFAGVIPNYADWRNVISLIADDEDGNIHFQQSETIARYLETNHPVFNVEKIYLDAYEQTTLAGGARYPDVNRAINNRVNQGALLVNYIGHGGTLGLAQERILTFDDILSWGNYYNLPVFMTATCEFSSFDQLDPNELSAGVRVFLKPDGGAAALFTTTRLAYSHSNFTLNDAFMKNAFIPMSNGEMPRLGDLIRIAKVQSSSVSTLKNFVLLGDPSMQMAYPKYRAITTHMSDTIKALEKVTVKGEIHTPQGTLATGYNGVIYPTVFDKKAVFFTLGNDPGSNVAQFEMQNRVIFSGQATIVNGLFEFSFIVPRDISYNTGQGKISYYFDDGQLFDGCGHFGGFTISGTSEDYMVDTQGPEISLFLNNQNFRSGDKTGPSPVLLAFLSDESGINTTGQIGHDIVAFLNNDTSNPIILSNYYQTELNSFTAGRVVFPFFNLDKGNYTLTFRAWDVHNNVSIASLDFVVTSAPGIQLTELLNKPNPLSNRTVFSIQHNKPATELRVLIDIFSLNGQLVKTIEEKVYASGYNIPPIEWDGSDNGGTLLGNGIYIFRALVSTADGDQAQKTEKLIILR